MTPQKGQYIKCILKNNLVVEGIVDSWSKDAAILATDGSSLSIIPNVTENVILVKIIFKTSQQVKSDLEQKFHEVHQSPSDDDLRNQKMADLKILMIEQDKKIVSEKLKDHNITDIKRATYDQLGILKKQSTQLHSTKKDTRKD